MIAGNLRPDWTVVVPIRDPRTGKSRLRAGTAVHAAIAHDTLESALGCAAVRHLILVSDDAGWSADIRARHPAMSLHLQEGGGLGPAVSEGLRRAGNGNVAVMLGDLPALRPEDLELALQMAEDTSLGMVTDHRRTGTTLITARRGAEHRPSFGPGSAQRHRRLGYQELPLPPSSSLRRDVDTAQDLREALARGTGPATRRALAKRGVVTA